MIIFVLALILFIISCVLFYQAKQIRTERQNEIAYIQQQIQNKEHELYLLKQKTVQALSQNQQQTKRLLNQKLELNQQIKEQQKELHETLLTKQKRLNQQYEHNKWQTSKAFESYCDTLDQLYTAEEHRFTAQLNALKTEREQAENQLAQIKKVYEAATAARLREQENEQKWSFYKIRLTDQQATDIARIQKLKQNLYDPTIVSKVIWSAYILKPTSDLCNRVLGSKTVCGIYKITNKATGEVYIGQSVNIAQRWKQHIKCGLGIDASSTNKLYNIMQNTGVWNFTFEVLEECSRDKLNEKEKFWIEMYQSNKIGLNSTKGGA